MRSTVLLCSALLLLSTPLSAKNLVHEVLYTDGQHVLIASTDDPYTVPTVMVANGQTVLHEGGPAPWTAGETIVGLNNGLVGISGGGIALRCFTDGPSSSDGYVVRFDGSWTVEAQESGPVAGVAGATYNSMKTVSIDNNGAIGFWGAISGANFSLGLFHGATVLARATIDAPTGQLTGNNDVYTAFRNSHEIRISPDGTRWATLAYLSYPMVLAVDNAVVVQENYAIPGSGSSALAWDTTFTDFDSANRWYGMGRFLPTNSRNRWAVRDGVILAQTGQETYVGSGYNWAESIEFVTGDAAGNSNVGGDYSVPPYGIGRAVVKNGTTPLLLDGDPIDMDGNGLFDDKVELYMVKSFGKATDDGSIYTVLFVQDLNQSQFGNVFLRIGPPRPELELLNLVAGQTAELKLRFASPGDLVYMGYSLAGAGPTTVSSPWGPLVVALSPPFVQLPALAADPNGEAVHTAPVTGVVQ